MRFHELEETARSTHGAALMGMGNDTSRLIHDIQNAQKFYMGAVEAFDTVAIPSDAKTLNLPYPICAFEYEVETYSTGAKTNFIHLCTNRDNPNNTIQLSLFIKVARTLIQGSAKDWMHLGSALIDQNTNTFTLYNNTSTVSRLDIIDKITNIRVAYNIDQLLSESVTILLRVLGVLNCSNVQIEEVPTSRVLNTIRRTKRKLPIYAYKTLVLKSNKKKILTNLGSTHESPRIHLRRGHIKHRKTGDFWWQPCVVGNQEKGVIVKDYKANNIMA